MLDLSLLDHMLLLVLNLFLLIFVVDVDQILRRNFPVNLEILDIVIVIDHVLLLEIQIDAKWVILGFLWICVEFDNINPSCDDTSLLNIIDVLHLISISFVDVSIKTIL